MPWQLAFKPVLWVITSALGTSACSNGLAPLRFISVHPPQNQCGCHRNQCHSQWHQRNGIRSPCRACGTNSTLSALNHSLIKLTLSSLVPIPKLVELTQELLAPAPMPMANRLWRSVFNPLQPTSSLALGTCVSQVQMQRL